MKRLLIWLRNLLALCLIAVFVYCAVVTYQGYQLYREAVEAVPLSQKVEEVRSAEHYTKLTDISEYFIDALVAVEDHRFFDHKGVELRSIIRAVITNLNEGEYAEGGSTITQQLAKKMYFRFEKKMPRKVAEALVAFDLEREYEKDDILEMYVNIIYFGDGYTGIWEAAQGYFGKAPAELDFDEATLLAGLPKAPSSYALSNGREKAEERQEDVIEAMVHGGYVSEEEADGLLVEAR